MSNKITIKRSAVPGKIPLPGDLEFGEFAINYADGNLFFKDSSNTVATLASTQFVSVTGNVTGGNIVTLGTVSAAGNVAGNYFIGNGAFLTGIASGSGMLVGTVDDFTGDGSTVAFTLSVTPTSENVTSVNISGVSQLKTAYSITSDVITFSSAPAAGAAIEVTTLSGSVMSVGNIENGTSNVTIPVANGNVTISVAGTDNVAVITATGVTVTGNISANYILGNGSQLTGLPEGYANADVAAYLPTYTGNLVSLQGNVTTTANISGAYILGNGAGLTSIAGANVTGQVSNALVAGTVYTAAQPNITSIGTLTNLDVTGNAVVGGNLVVNGNTIQVNIEQLNVQDPIIGLGRGANNAPLTTNDGKDRGTEMWYYTSSEQAAFVGYQNSTGNIIAASNISVTNEIVTVNSYGNFVAGNVIGATVSASGNITGAYFIGNGSQLTGLPESGLSWTTQANTAPANAAPGDFWYDSVSQVKYQYINDGTSNVWVDQSYPTTFSTISVLNIQNGGANGTGNIGASNNTFNTVFAKATSAQYADLAEIYTADQDYQPGTVVVFGGTHEITVTDRSHDTRVAGVISQNPAFLMNSHCDGLPVAFTGRVPCRVRGPVAKGDVLVTASEPGVAQRIEHDYRPGSVLGKSLGTISDSSVCVIEVVVGRF